MSNIYLENGYTISIDCLQRFNITLGDFIGTGNFSVVYDACVNEICMYVIKIVLIEEITFGNSFDDEVDIYIEMSKIGVAPKYIDSWKCFGHDQDDNEVQLGVLLTEKYDTTLRAHLEEKQKISVDIIKLLQDKVDVIHKHGYVHNDLHSGNVMVKYNDLEITDIVIIDFGLAFNINNPPNNKILRSYISHNASTSRFKLTDSDPIKILLVYDTINIFN